MARRKDGGFELLAELPWPVAFVLGIVGLLACKALLPNGLDALGYLVMVVCWLAALVSFAKRVERAGLLETRTGLESLKALSWRDFEKLVGEAFRRQGYAVVENGLGGADGGVDLVLRRDGRVTLVQCKQWKSRAVNVSTVREMWGLLSHHQADAVKIVCVGEFTRDAQHFVAGKPVELIGGAELLALVRTVQTSSAQTATAPRAAHSGAHVQPVEAIADPACPRCSAGMTLRRNRRNGESFWGCSNYPGCRGTRPA